METLRNAPIIEAVLDIRVTFETLPEVRELEALFPEVKQHFPKKELLSRFQASFGIDQGHPQAGFQGQPSGFMFKASDGQRILQMRLDGFTFNWLRPYDTWESFRDSARLYWNLFNGKTSPSAVDRLALRYINRFELPQPVSDIDRYLHTGPKISGKISHALGDFFLRFETAPDEDTRAIVSVVKESSVAQSKHYAIILDIDVFQQVNLKPNDEGLWERFEKIREFKNEVFFNSVTEETLELFR